MQFHDDTMCEYFPGFSLMDDRVKERCRLILAKHLSDPNDASRDMMVNTKRFVDLKASGVKMKDPECSTLDYCRNFVNVIWHGLIRSA